VLPPLPVDDHVSTPEERAEERELDSYLDGREEILTAQLHHAKESGDIALGCRAISEATCYGDPGDPPRYSTEEVIGWLGHARAHDAFFLGLGEVGKVTAFGERTTIRGLLRSALMPTAPLREAVAEFMHRTETPLTDIARDAADHLKRLTGEKSNWAERNGNQFRFDLGMRSRTHKGNTNALRSFLCINKASAIAYAIQTTPFEIGA